MTSPLQTTALKKLEEEPYTHAQLLLDMRGFVMPENWLCMQLKDKFLMFVEYAPPDYLEGKKIVVTNSMDVKFFYKSKPVLWISCEKVGSKDQVKEILDLYNIILSLN